ncbi:MAG: 2-C-methyl-D-erythritol 4-phosphate cytidylyltransferase [Clostridiales bacterium]|nr:2-C-methyl-D-erythritol 4-phosphate cytidylyltransferase [Clostridiales bacterium]
MKKYTAIVLAAGAGKRMNTKVHKQYLEVAGKPVLYYTLKAFEESAVSDIVLVTGAGEEDYCQKQIIKKYGFEKVKAIVTGGKERYHSVYQGLLAAEGADYVLIHDGARPLVDSAIIQRSMDAVLKYQACVVGMPVKDTIKIVNEEQFAKETPDRNKLWQVQTPQTFSYILVKEAYQKMLEQEDAAITDDAMVVERMTSVPVKLIEGSYRNIKITTPEDLLVAEAYLLGRDKNI